MSGSTSISHPVVPNVKQGVLPTDFPLPSFITPTCRFDADSFPWSLLIETRNAKEKSTGKNEYKEHQTTSNEDFIHQGILLGGKEKERKVEEENLPQKTNNNETGNQKRLCTTFSRRLLLSCCSNRIRSSSFK